jgi:phosphopantetheine--protein transferase-like protein
MKLLYQIEALPVVFDEKLFLKSLNSDEQKRFSEMQDSLMQKTFLYSRYLVKNALSEILQIEPSQINFTIDKNGKPFLLDSPWYFSISHSEDLCGFAISQKPIGLDIQMAGDGKSAEKLIKRFFHPSESAYFSQQDENGKREVFYRLWVIKESWGKAKGTGLQNLQTLDFSEVISEKENEFEAFGAQFQYEKKTHPLEKRKKYYLAFCHFLD